MSGAFPHTNCILLCKSKTYYTTTTIR